MGNPQQAAYDCSPFASATTIATLQTFDLHLELLDGALSELEVPVHLRRSRSAISFDKTISAYENIND